jgi:hypothetical protein
MATITDSQNVVNSLETAPDRLRAEIGSYFSESPSLSNISPRPTDFSFRNYAAGVKNHYITTIADNDQVLFPTKRATIYLSGVEERFRDHDQWQDYIRQTITTGTSFLDHQFDLDLPENQIGVVVKNFHQPDYEDATKTFPSNQLLNYNLISYPFKDQAEDVSRIGDIRTQFDDENYVVGESVGLDNLMEEYANRVSNYTGSVEELSVKQRHIFDLQSNVFYGANGGLLALQGVDPMLVSQGEFPFFFRKRLPFIQSDPQFDSYLSDFSKRKQIMQSIKQDLSFANRSFRIGLEDVNAKIYNLINLMTSTRIADFNIGSDEIFLLPENEISNSHESDRFLNGVNAVRFLGNMRNFINSKQRDYETVANSNPCETFFLGYKIEKYLDNDATQPIQTYYTNDPVFYDTQMKYGRKYIYKTKVLIGILGSSYTYSGLAMSQNENQMVNEEGQVVTELSSNYGDIINEKYRAYVNVEVTPSFQVLEYMVDQDEVTFVDDTPDPPQVYFYNQPHKATTEFFFSPMYEDREGTNDEIRFEYLNGVYEIYRLDESPKSMIDFEDALLATVDDQTTLTNVSDDIPDYLVDNMNAHYEDRIVQNQKYYYAFREVTYHGTQSEFTAPFEVEMLKDSDEYKVMVKEYQFPESKDYTFEARAKRILKITPNIERLLFSEEENTNDWKLDDANMLAKNQTTKFKIRVTSKHTGKKMDINLNFFLDDKTNR